MDKVWDNIEIKDEKLTAIRRIFREKGYPEVSKVIQVSKIRPVYRVYTKIGGSIRFDWGYVSEEAIRLQSLAFGQGVSVPRLLSFCKRDGMIFKFSEWVEGKEIIFVWNKAKMFIEAGKMLGHLQSVKDPKTGLRLFNKGFTSKNAVWTNYDKVNFVDCDKLALRENDDKFLDYEMAKTSIKRIAERKRIDLFMKGYSNYRNPESVYGLMKSMNWNWMGEHPLRGDEFGELEYG